MKLGSCFNIARVGGIPVRVHATFIILPLWVILEDLGNAIPQLLMVLAVFSCVVLHEFGHSLTARAFGISTRDITLYPFGGVAAVTREPLMAQELLVSLAGPMVNFLIAGSIYGLAVALPQVFFNETMQVIARELLIANVFLGVFNLIPAYPMDGGRVLRGLLSLMRVRSATIAAVRVSQVLTLGMFAASFYFELPTLGLVALVVFFAARDTARRARGPVAAQEVG